MGEFSHYSDEGMSRMVDVSEKKITTRTAKATGYVRMKDSTIDLIEKDLLPKGNIFEVARVSGIMAAKRTSDMIPMCHQLNLTYVNVMIAVDRSLGGVKIESEIRLDGKTGAEMEALTAVTVAGLTIYDMCKAVDKEMELNDVKLVEKTGGKSDYRYKSTE